jgi:hypothetical protein
MMDVRTLYLRHVPDDVAAALERGAVEAGVSLNAYVVARLTSVAAQRRNAELLRALPDLGIPIEDIVADVRALRDGGET